MIKKMFLITCIITTQLSFSEEATNFSKPDIKEVEININMPLENAPKLVSKVLESFNENDICKILLNNDIPLGIKDLVATHWYNENKYKYLKPSVQLPDLPFVSYEAIELKDKRILVRTCSLEPINIIDPNKKTLKRLNGPDNSSHLTQLKNKNILTINGNNKPIIWNPDIRDTSYCNTTQPLTKKFNTHHSCHGETSAVIKLGNDKILTTSCREVIIWDSSSMQEIKRFEVPYYITCATKLNNEKILFGSDDKLLICDINDYHSTPVSTDMVSSDRVNELEIKHLLKLKELEHEKPNIVSVFKLKNNNILVIKYYNDQSNFYAEIYNENLTLKINEVELTNNPRLSQLDLSSIILLDDGNVLVVPKYGRPSISNPITGKLLRHFSNVSLISPLKNGTFFVISEKNGGIKDYGNAHVHIWEIDIKQKNKNSNLYGKVTNKSICALIQSQ